MRITRCELHSSHDVRTGSVMPRISPHMQVEDIKKHQAALQKLLDKWDTLVAPCNKKKGSDEPDGIEQKKPKTK